MKTYRAFISYSQQDKVWGKRLHGWLEGYRLPSGVDAPVAPGERLGRFFRDDEEMAAASNIANIVERSIDDSEALIVICSPRSAKSQWVAAEIEQFRRRGPDAKVFAFIIDGIPNSGDPDTECFPAALRRVQRSDRPEELPVEPLGLDIRKDGRDRAVARLAAGLLGVDFDDLWQRDRRRDEARLRQMVLGLAGLSIVFAALAAAAVIMGLEARRNEKAAHDNLAGFFAERAWQNLESGNTLAAARYALAGRQLSEPNARSYHAVLGAAMFASGETLPPLLHDGPVYSATYSVDGQLVVTTGEDGSVKLWSAQTGALVAKLEGHGGRVNVASLSPGGTSLATGGNDGKIVFWDVDGLSMIAESPGHGAPVQTIRHSKSGKEVLTAGRDGTARIWNSATGEELRRFGSAGDTVWSAEYSADGQYVLTAHEDGVARLWSSGAGVLVRELVRHARPV